jgi:copper(I)-binding protein
LLAGIICLLLASPATAHSHKKKNLEIVHPWTPETLRKEATTAHVFMTIRNGGRVADRLVSASTARAQKVELVAGETEAKDGKSRAPFSIGPGKVLVLHAKGQHLVLTGMSKALHAYDDFKLVLVFEKAGRMIVDVVVEEAEGSESHRH